MTRRLTASERPSLGVRVVMSVAGVIAAAGTWLAPPAAAAPVVPQAASGVGVYGFGTNSSGELGNGTTTPSTTPVRAVGLPGTVRQVAAGDQAGAALLSDGTVWTWGSSVVGALGYPTAAGNVTVPRQVPGLSGIVQIAMGADGSDGYAVGSDGTVWAWGNDNRFGQLGNGTLTKSISPARVPGLTGVVQLSAGSTFEVLVLKSDGTVWGWGLNQFGDLGDGTTTMRRLPIQARGLTAVTSVAAGAASFAVRSDGTLFSWGANNFGQLGTGRTSGDVPTPSGIFGITGVTQVTTNGSSVLAIAGTNEQLWAWGSNTCGQLGDGTKTAKFAPERIGLVGVAQVAVGATDFGEDSAGAVRFDGSLWTWGSNVSGQLDNGTPVGGTATTPTPVTNLVHVSQFAFGQDDPNGLGEGFGLAIGSLPAVVPNLNGDTQGQASQALQAAGLVLGTVSTIVDGTCSNIGTVLKQNPGPGTTVLPGTAVSITIGKSPPPPHQCF